jgi:hypothetical protein
MKAYVGMANAVPDSRTPRRFSNVMTTTMRIATGARCAAMNGMAAAAFSTPEDTDTATVRT